MTDFFHAEDGVLVANLSGFVTRQQAWAAGFRWVAALLMHDPAADGNLAEIGDRGSAYRAEGWRLCGWGTYGQSALPEDDARTAVRLCVNLGLDGWVADGEAWAEGPNRPYSGRFIDAWAKAWAAAGRTPVPLACAPLSSETGNFPRDFDYGAFTDAGAAIMPQVYGNDIPTLTVSACLMSTARVPVPQTELSLMLGTYDTGKPVPYADYQGWSGARVIYLGDRTPADAWVKLSRAAARPGTPPREEPPMPPSPIPLPKGSLSALQVPDTTPYALAGNPHGYPSKGPTVEAMKRALSRAGAPTLPWRDFDRNYNADLENAWDWYDLQHGVAAGNGYGAGRLRRLRGMRVAGQPTVYALDGYGRTMIQNEAGAATDSNPLAKLQAAITAGCLLALANGSRWRYDERIRPVLLGIDLADPPATSDCSGSVIQIVDAARRKIGLATAVADPSKQGWSGFGNTDLYEEDWLKVSSPFRVGDLAHFSGPRHVALCYQAGTRSTAKWWSFGHEPPQTIMLDSYRPEDFMFVVRPDYIQATG